VNSELYRPEALTAYRERWIGRPAYALVRQAQWAAACLLPTAGALLCWAALSSWPTRLEVVGEVQANGGIAELTAPVSGVIEGVHVALGQRVSRDQVLVTISGGVDASPVRAQEMVQQFERELAERERLSAQLVQERSQWLNQFDQQQQSLRREAALVEQQLTQAEAQAATGRKLLEVYRESGERGLIPEVQVIERQQSLQALDEKVLLLRAQIESTGRRLLEQAQARDSRLLDLEARLAAIGDTVVGLQDSLRRARNEIGSEIRSPVAGIVSGLWKHPGNGVAEGELLLQILPSGAELQALAQIPNAAVESIQVGDLVALRFDAYPHQKFGKLPSRVDWISDLPTPPQSSEAAAPQYLSRLSLPEALVTPDGDTRPLRVGMRFKAEITIEQRSLWDLVFAR